MTAEIVRRAAGFIRMGRPKPVWYDTIAQKYPPLTFAPPKGIKANSGPRPKNGPEPLWRPPKLEYPEDKFVKKIYQMKPIEKLRPTSLSEMENDPNDAQQIIKDQLELMEGGMSPEEAFTKASSQFWERSERQEIMEKVAREQERFIEQQAKACTGRPVHPLRHEAVGETIRRILLEEKAKISTLRRKERA